MAQDFTASMRQLWTDEHSKIDGLYSPAEKLCGKEAEGALRSGGGNSYTFLEIGVLDGMDIDPYGTVVAQDATDTLTTLTLDKTSQYTFRQEEDEKGRYQAFDSFRAKQFKLSVLEHFRKTNGEFFFTAFSEATNEFDDGDLGGTAGNPIEITQANIDNVAFELSAQLEEISELGGGFAIAMTPRQISKLNLAAFGSGAAPSADAFGGKLNLGIENSYVGNYLELDFYKTTRIPTGKEITYTGQPADTNTIIVNGITITFVATLTGGNGEVLIGASADATYTNLVALLNNPAINTANAKGWALNDANYKKARYFGGKLDTTNSVVDVLNKNGNKTIAFGTVANATLGTDTIAYNLLTRVGAVEMACPRGVRLTDGKNDDGTVMTYTSRKRFGVAVPSQNVGRYAIIKTKI